MAVTVTILETRENLYGTARECECLFTDGVTQKVLLVGAVPLGGNAQAHLDSRKDELWPQALACGGDYDPGRWECSRYLQEDLQDLQSVRDSSVTTVAQARQQILILARVLHRTLRRLSHLRD